MGPRTRTTLAFIFAVVVCTYHLLGVGAAHLVSPWWPLAAVLVVAIALALNASEMRAAGTPIGFSHGRRLPIAGLNFSFIVTVLILAATLGAPLLR